MRDINKIIIHCSDTPEGRWTDAEEIDRWHKARGWSGIGYHYVVLLDGSIEYGRDVSKQGAHVKGHNIGSIGVCYVGGRDLAGDISDTRTCEQKEALLLLLGFLRVMHPNADIQGHRDFSSKECPSFDATAYYKHV